VDINETYKKLTGVDVLEQKRLWNERGKGYYGEFLVFREIYSCLPGCCKLVMNIEIPSPSGGKTEIDLVLIHETGLYVFEVKHYKGTIYGTIHENRWTQYFRTAKNNSFRNPVEQNQYHIEALRKLYPGIPICSFIVFTSPECDLRITGYDELVDIGKVNGLMWRLGQKIAQRAPMLSMERIDNIFEELVRFAPDANREVEYQEASVPFYKLADAIKEHAETTIKKEKVRIVNLIPILGSIWVVVLVVSILVANARIRINEKACDEIQKSCEVICADYQNRYEELAQKFVKVEYLNNGDLVMRDDIVTVAEVRLEKSKDVLNAIQCDIWINVTSEDYGIQVPQDAKIIVMLSNGNIQEYEFWGKRHKYNERSSCIGSSKKTIQLLPQEFYNVEVEEIEQIKLTGLTLFKWTNRTWGYRENVLTGMEFGVYERE